LKTSTLYKEPDLSQAAFEFPKPQEKQVDFFNVKNKHIAYGGARGGGKSWAMRWKAVYLCMKYSGLKTLLLRRTFPELEANHLMPLKKALKAKAHTLKNGQKVLVKVANYKAAEKAFEFANGSILKLGYCQYEADADQYQGHEYDVICFEEATRFTESQLTFISTCLRSPRPDFESRIYYTCNPGGPGHAYIKRLFIDCEYEDLENLSEYSFVKSLVYDNEIIMKNDKNYVQILNNLPEDLRRAHRDGDWDALAGQYFSEFRRSVHVIEPFKIPNHWFRYISIDYGLDKFAVLFYAVDFEKNVYVTHEIHVSDLIVSQAAKLLNTLIASIPGFRQNIRGMYAPPDLGSRKYDTGKTALQLFHESGLTFDVSANHRVNGWYACKELLYFEYEDRKDIDKGLKMRPIVQIFNTCKFLIKHLPLAQRDDKKPEDIATEPHEITHILDAFRYFSVRWYKGPSRKAKSLKKGTMYHEKELIMMGYNPAQINRMIEEGLVKVGSFFGPPEISIDK